MNKLKLGLVATALLVSAFAQAHHARFGFFSPDKTVEVEGVVTSLRWANPHVHMQLSVTNSSGEIEQWHAELAALSSFRNRGITDPLVEVGEKISLFGKKSRQGATELSPTNLLREDGTEVILDFRAAPYFGARSSSQFVDPKASEDSKRLARESAEGIFRVWSTPPSTRAFLSYYGDFPLTPTAAEAKAQFNPSSEDLLSCWNKGMPLLMVTPHPMAFSRSGDDILLRYEEDDAVRVIHMNGDDSKAVPSELGYSTGTWEGNTLVVETNKINSPIFDDVGTPQSKDVHLIERFTMTEDESRLDYSISVTDPATFTETIELSRYWIWIPERAIQKWNCQD